MSLLFLMLVIWRVDGFVERSEGKMSLCILEAKANLTRESVRVAQARGGLCLVLVLSGIGGACSAEGGAEMQSAVLLRFAFGHTYVSPVCLGASTSGACTSREKNPDRKMDGSPHKPSRVPVLDTDQLMLGASRS
ncbi:hypothetical protein M441DRAFT_68943 [Trichoderma asperellum CBS 433.97]|uniref:Secreted protein n=1 Tax=Trichoderma asperellum (strain ATCC 204424 / CBS 433.97 / NBRC 101777) TaxID=1042311 RepID=A0A2T3Z6N3_TRIA4|nr:hypothetical protein M441DRAFT_68943 [Trichoderma asperellum CBS 433.97]PTB40483.1 hypothetical protein M441DRAFT_68943 [Trichoderma asperellum CBS 433.97]